MKTINTWLIAVLICIGVGSGWQLDADGVADHSGEWAESTELAELQATEEGTERRQVAAQNLCNAERGPNSEARWTPEGHLVCTTRRGERPVLTADAQQVAAP
jgi:hypothetical protein